MNIKPNVVNEIMAHNYGVIYNFDFPVHCVIWREDNLAHFLVVRFLSDATFVSRYFFSFTLFLTCLWVHLFQEL